jgi:RNA polymerase sigma-70 factor (ECF subfamily)
MPAISLRTPEVIDLGTRFAADDAAAMADPESLATADRDAHAMADRDAAAMADRLPVLTPVLRSYLRRWVPLDDVDDVVQVVFLELWRTRVRYDPARSLEAWALSIARRRAIDHLRARPRPAAPLGELAEPPGEDGRDLAARLADAAEIRGALGTLPAAQREAIEMAYYGDLSQREIAERLSVPIGTIKARTARGLRAVRQMLTSAAREGIADAEAKGGQRG